MGKINITFTADDAMLSRADGNSPLQVSVMGVDEDMLLEAIQIAKSQNEQVAQ